MLAKYCAVYPPNEGSETGIGLPAVALKLCDTVLNCPLRAVVRMNIMSDLMERVSGFFTGLKRKAGEVVETKEIAIVRGKTAAKAVYSDSGELIVDAGHPIDDAAIERAHAAGKMNALTAAAVSSQAQDFKERARTAYAATPEGTEARSMASSEQYIEARQYIGRVAAVDVTDLRGNIIVPAGKKIDDEYVRAAREAEQLGSLIYSAQQSPASYPTAAPPPPKGTPIAAPVTEAKRAARPLSEYYDEEQK